MKKNIALLITGGLLTWLGLCLSAAIDMLRAAKKDWEATGKSCTPDCKCMCQQVTCGCHLGQPRPGAPITRPKYSASYTTRDGL